MVRPCRFHVQRRKLDGLVLLAVELGRVEGAASCSWSRPAGPWWARCGPSAGGASTRRSATRSSSWVSQAVSQAVSQRLIPRPWTTRARARASGPGARGAGSVLRGTPSTGRARRVSGSRAGGGLGRSMERRSRDPGRGPDLTGGELRFCKSDRSAGAPARSSRVPDRGGAFFRGGGRARGACAYSVPGPGVVLLAEGTASSGSG